MRFRTIHRRIDPSMILRRRAELPPSRGPCGAYVLDKQQPSARLQDTPDLVQCRSLIRNRAQDERRDHGVEAPVRERQFLRPGRRNLDGDASILELLAKPLTHERVRFGGDYPIYVAVVR